MRRLLRWLLLPAVPADIRVLHALDTGHRYASHITAAYGVRPGRLYPVLGRLTALGMVSTTTDVVLGHPRQAFTLAPAASRTGLRLLPSYQLLCVLVGP